MTKIGEALNRRADLQSAIARLQERIKASAKVAEGEEPVDDPNDLLTQVDELGRELARLVASINLTNAVVRMESGETVTEALAWRDALMLRTSVIRSAIDGATDRGTRAMFGSPDTKFVRQVNVRGLQVLLDAHAKAHRELDNNIQELNWTTDLIE